MFDKGNIIKKPKGRSRYKILKTRDVNHRFGDLFIQNLDSGSKYWTYSNQNWALSFFLEPKKVINKKFKF